MNRIGSCAHLMFDRIPELNNVLSKKVLKGITVIVGAVALVIFFYYRICWSRQKSVDQLDGRVDSLNQHDDKVSPVIKKILNPWEENSDILEADSLENTVKKMLKPQPDHVRFQWKPEHLHLDSEQDSLLGGLSWVKGLDGKMTHIRLPKPDQATVQDLVTAVAVKVHLPANNIRLIFAGRQLNNKNDLHRLLKDTGFFQEGWCHLVLRPPQKVESSLNSILENISGQNTEFSELGCENVEMLDGMVLSIIDRIYRGKLDEEPMKKLEQFTKLINLTKSKVQEQHLEMPQEQELLSYLDNIGSMIQCCETWYQKSLLQLPVFKTIKAVIQDKLKKNPAWRCALVADMGVYDLISPEGKRVSLNQTVLFKVSPYFEACSKYPYSSQSKQYQFSEENVNSVIFDTITEFLLTGKADVLSRLEENDLMGLYIQADLLQIDHLEALCAEQIIQRYIDSRWEEEEFINAYYGHPKTLGTILNLIK